MIRILFLMAMISYILATLLPQQQILNQSVSALCMLIVLFSLRRVRGLAMAFGLSFLCLGSLMLLISHAAVASFLFSFGEMIQMVTLFTMVPILALPIRLGRYAHELNQIIRKKVSSPPHLYRLISCLSFFFSSFMNLAALPLAYHAVASSIDYFRIEHKSRWINCAITHGYAMPLLWSPITPIVGTVLYLTGTTYAQILLPLILLSICGLLLDWRLAGNGTSRLDYVSAEQETAVARAETVHSGQPRRKPWQIAAAVLALNGVILLLDHLSSFSFLFLVSVIVFPFALLWCWLIGQARPFFTRVKDHFSTYIPHMQNQFFIFLTAGFFITALRISHTDTVITQGVEVLIQFTGLRAFLVLLPLIPFLLAFIGLHPAVGLALIAEALKTQALLDAPIVVTVAMLGGAIPAFLMGPYNATLGMMAALINEKPLTLSNWNFPFTWRYLLLLTLFVQLLYLCFST
ncbi:hypothetical protein [Sporolactobacillus terrae]|uniref:hypothetical protein n=1 Tax=Sporolactobacillus terrae TaxID=269673 RepID=UPI00111B83D9|nr:hypothetical protein [Sporolactobacillus terrae]